MIGIKGDSSCVTRIRCGWSSKACVARCALPLEIFYSFATLRSDLFGISDNTLDTIVKVSTVNAACTPWWGKLFTVPVWWNLFTNWNILSVYLRSIHKLTRIQFEYFSPIFPQNNVQQWRFSDLALKPFLLFSA